VCGITDPILLPELHKVLTSRFSNETIQRIDESSERALQHGFEDGFQVATGRDPAPNPFLAPKCNMVGILDSVGKILAGLLKKSSLGVIDCHGSLEYSRMQLRCGLEGILNKGAGIGLTRQQMRLSFRRPPLVPFFHSTAR
jgi:hypothetical protein